MSLPPRWVRRVLLAPVLPVVFALLVVAFPFAIPIGAFVTRYLPGRLRVLSLAWLVFVWLLRETVVVVSLLGLWLLSGFGTRLDRPWFQSQHVRLIGWYLRGLVGVMQGSLGLRLVTEAAPGELVVEPRMPSRPMLVMSRHAGAGDSFILVHLLVNVFGRWPTIVLKDTLQWLPSLDIALNRMGAAFVSAGSLARVVDAIATLSGGLRDDGALVIFPEGGNFTIRRRARALERLAKDDLARFLTRAEELTTVLPPRTGGVTAALGANPDADVVIVAHTGLEGYSNVGDVLAKLPMQHSVRLAFWHVPRAQVPTVSGVDQHFSAVPQRPVVATDPADEQAGPDDRSDADDRDGVADWLYAWWEHIDTWVVDHDEPGVPDQRPGTAHVAGGRRRRR